MKIKASGRLALIIATGLFVCIAGPLPASAAGSDTAASTSDSATAGKSVRQSSRHGKRYAHRKSDRTADKSDSKKDVSDAGSVTAAGIPASVANANAELTSNDTNAVPKAGPMLAAADRPASDTSVVASDQLNDVDRALQQAQPAEQPQPVQQQAAQQETPPAPPQTVAMAPDKPAPVLASGDSSTWDQTSLIGKIFIGFGALLTVASAARMFMA
ncbi:hypothetical protein UP10_00385 [Bradyrhizobium sp. LTSPM299]|uniref:hypothetical protein n=1 Tax=Bradyrhizobium sp. LTSPM299 TaxID=1619233 RepID=UPI0005C9E46E|nr:hypothetical protein [Bradyrhizobium sp. LTSPM299]KJC62684.1 hypothetical protein UP10_00385 [Bradyrhizobium sp. LTSPM299]